MNASLLLDAILDVLRTNASRPVVGVRSAWGKLKNVAAAPAGTTLLAPDGTTYTGVVVIERSRAVLLLALRHDDIVEAGALPPAANCEAAALVEIDQPMPTPARGRRSKTSPKPQ